MPKRDSPFLTEIVQLGGPPRAVYQEEEAIRRKGAGKGKESAQDGCLLSLQDIQIAGMLISRIVLMTCPDFRDSAMRSCLV
jgi:hypothetical protein